MNHRVLLEDEQAQLSQKLAELGFGNEGGLDYDSNFADTSQVTAERGEAETLAVQLRDALADVNDALAKLDAGTFGFCEECGRPISPPRLEAMPAARFCIDHANRR